MKNNLLLLLCCMAGITLHAQHSVTKLWQTDSVLAVPESALLKDSILYVSLIDGAPDGKDGKGGIAKIGIDGKIINLQFTTGLNAPKGSGIYQNTLYVADLDVIVAIDLTNGSIIKKIPVPGASFLNDITIDDNGTIYVSDSKGNKIYMVQNKQPAVFIENAKNVNGVLAVGSNLYFLAYGELYRTDASKQLIKIAEGMEPSTDGLQKIDDSAFLVSSWIGSIYYVSTDGKVERLLDTRDKKINTADLCYDPVKHIAYVPTFFKKSLIAFELK